MALYTVLAIENTLYIEEPSKRDGVHTPCVAFSLQVPGVALGNQLNTLPQTILIYFSAVPQMIDNHTNVHA